MRWEGAQIADLFRKFHLMGVKLSGGAFKGESMEAEEGGGLERAGLVRALGLIRCLQVGLAVVCVCV